MLKSLFYCRGNLCIMYLTEPGGVIYIGGGVVRLNLPPSSSRSHTGGSTGTLALTPDLN